MTADRGELAGVGLAFAFHVALVVALSTQLADLTPVESPPMEVELVDEIALQSMAPTSIPQPASSDPPPAPSDLERVPEPDQVTPQPTPRAVPTPTARPAPTIPRPRTPTPSRPAPRQGLGDDFLDKLGPSAPARPAAPIYDAKARASVTNSISAQAQRCADREPFVGEGADRIRMTVSLQFTASGRLSRPPRITNVTGPSDLRAKYGEVLEDQVRRIFADCAPFDLPRDLYDTLDGGWRNTTITYRVNR